jgi:sulfite reductase alpha subunit-like flavoprotein
MGRGVNQALEDIIRQYTGEDQLAAKAKVDQMEKDK